MPIVEDYERDLAKLSADGYALYYGLFQEHGTEQDRKKIPKDQKLASFSLNYQKWYTECLALLLQIVPERVDDFRALYAPKNVRKEIDYSNYTISDALKGLIGRRYGDILYEPVSAATAMLQQAAMIGGLKSRFKSTLYDIKTLVHADLLDDELHAAEVLNKNGFQRGAGAVAGVVLEGHLGAVCDRHQVKLKPKPTISTLNDALKDASVMDISQWRFVQHLGDIRNKCDHKLVAEPTREEVQELIEGVRKMTKTVI
ncbi:hypothetical protein AB4Z25_01720 [Rhizobium sp. RAF36]|uniref:hypothetical protein n=1 Tax=Rhizobium sp. RAF36 TaxID=3233055 RepID=UPI000DD5143E